MKKFYLLSLSIGFTFISFSQQLTANFGASSVKLDWQRAGFPGDTVPTYSIVKDITSFGANNTGATSTNAAFAAAVTSLAGANGVIYFPPGNYLFTATLFLRSGLILRGAGAGNTTLTFNLPGEGDLIRASGTAGASTPITAAVAQYGNQVTVTDPNIASMGSFVKIYQNNESSLINDSWADNTIGQISCLKSKLGNTFTFYSRHRRAIPLAGAPTAQVLNMIRGVGIECLKIKRMDADLTANQTSNIYFNYAAYCWVKGIESDSANFAHVNIFNSSNIEVTGNFFHGAFSYGGGGEGYGVVCHLSTGDCLIENNIFRHLRHAMLLQAGANGNVYAYNYSLQQQRTEFPSDGAADIILHGNYPYANLFEGNIGQNMGGDVSHGKNGPTNVYFRNRALYYGIAFSSGSGDSSIVIYNEVTGTGSANFIPLGQLSTSGANTIASQNHRQTSGGFVGNMETRFAPNAAATLAYFLEPVRPYFFSSDLQPLGYPNAYNPSLSNPARNRYISGGDMTYCSNRSRKDSIMPISCSPLAIASNGGYDVHDINETTEFRDNSNCGWIAKIVASGGSPVNGVITTKSKVEVAVPQYGGKAFVPRHYDIEPSSNPATSTATITLYFNQSDFNAYNAENGDDGDLPSSSTDIAGKANLRITQYHGTGTAPGNYTGSTVVIDPDDANIVWNAATNLWEITFDVSGFSGFYVNGAPAPLPVKLVSFRYSIPEQNKILLKWDVAEQQDIRSYVVERSADGRNYSAIGTVAANNESSYTYQFVDESPIGSTGYYRLKIVEDLVSRYSPILVVNLAAKENALVVYPVPAKNVVTIRLHNSALINSEAQLLNADGKQIRSIRLENMQQRLEIGQLPKGIYYLKTGQGYAYKIIKD